MGFVVTAPVAAADQVVTIEHGVHHADRRGLDVVVQPAQFLANLGRTPARVLTPESHDERFHLHRQLIGMPVGASAAVGQPDDATVLVALVDLVAGLARDIEFPAEHRHFLAAQQPGHEPEPLIHLGTLLPRHIALRQSAEVLPMSPE